MFKISPPLCSAAGAMDRLDDVIPETGPTITQIAHKISNWESISGYFDISEPEQTAIRSENQFSLNNQRMAFLRKWRSKNGKRATYRRLAELFKQSGDDIMSELVLGCCSDGGTSTQQPLVPPASHASHPPLAPSHPTIKRNDTPTLLELMDFPVQGGQSIDFTIAIGDNYMKFGTFLLKDEVGNIMNTLGSEHHYKSEKILHNVFSKWLTGTGMERTYETLVKCLRKSQCGALADRLEENLA